MNRCGVGSHSVLFQHVGMGYSTGSFFILIFLLDVIETFRSLRTLKLYNNKSVASDHRWEINVKNQRGPAHIKHQLWETQGWHVNWNSYQPNFNHRNGILCINCDANAVIWSMWYWWGRVLPLKGSSNWQVAGSFNRDISHMQTIGILLC